MDELELHGIPDYELRVCLGCGHSNVREHKPNRVAELRCQYCKGADYRLYDPNWQRRNEQTFVERFRDQMLAAATAGPNTVTVAELRTRYAMEDAR